MPRAGLKQPSSLMLSTPFLVFTVHGACLQRTSSVSEATIHVSGASSSSRSLYQGNGSERNQMSVMLGQTDLGPRLCLCWGTRSACLLDMCVPWELPCALLPDTGDTAGAHTCCVSHLDPKGEMWFFPMPGEKRGKLRALRGPAVAGGAAGPSAYVHVALGSVVSSSQWVSVCGSSGAGAWLAHISAPLWGVGLPPGRARAGAVPLSQPHIACGGCRSLGDLCPPSLHMPFFTHWGQK